MSNEEKNLPDAQDEPQAEAEKDNRGPLSDQKKNALLRYMAVLFGVAFLLVALSFLIQIRDSNVTISQLNQSNASALQNAEKLQSDNRDLVAENKRLHADLVETEDALEDAQAALSEAESRAVSAVESLNQFITDQEQYLSAMASLYVAVGAQLQNDVESCRTALSAVDADRLDSNGLAVYDKLKTWSAEEPQD